VSRQVQRSRKEPKGEKKTEKRKVEWVRKTRVKSGGVGHQWKGNFGGVGFLENNSIQKE